MKNMKENITFLPLRENFFDGVHRKPPKLPLHRQAKLVLWLFLERFPRLLKILSAMWRLLHLPPNHNVFGDIYQKTYNRLKAPLYEGKNNYFTFADNPYRIITMADDTRPAIVINNGSKILGRIMVEEDSRIRLGICLNEEINPKLFGHDCKVTVILKNKNESIKNSFVFPVNGHGDLFSHKLGQSWIDWYMDIPFTKPCEVELSLRADFLKDGKIDNGICCHAITWSAPQILVKRKKEERRKIIYLSMESLIDPLYLQKTLNSKLDIPNYNKLMQESNVYTRAYPAGDSTMPTIGTSLTGLLSLQHGIVNYRIKSWNSQVKALSPEIKTIAEILKEKGFYTQAYTFQPRLTARYGWYRGFDSYRHSGYVYEVASFPSKFAVDFLDEARPYNAFLFLHWDGLHDSKWTSEPSSRIVLQGSYNENYTMSEFPLYAERFHNIDIGLGFIINYLKTSGLWDESLIILTSDHGGAFPWLKGQDFALYEDRIRVPLLIKWPGSFQIKPSMISTPVSAQLKALSAIEQVLEISLPSYLKLLLPLKDKLNGMVISETVTHPRTDDYGCVLVSEKFKYFFRCKIDFDKYEIKTFLYHKLFQVTNGDVDETRDVSDAYRIETEKFKNLTTEIVKANLDFLREYPTVGLSDISYR